jgi:hypothetical protein
MSAIARIVLPAIALASFGCATTLSSFQPAHVAPRGHAQAEAGFDISYPASSLRDDLRAAEALQTAAQQRMLTDDERRAILAGGAALGLDPPAVIPHAGFAYSPFDEWEIGLRLAASGWRAGVRRQLVHQETSGFDLTIGAGVGRAAFTPPINDVLTTLDVTDYGRWNVDFPIAFGRRGSWYRVWGGPRILYSSTSQSFTLSLPNEPVVTGTISGSGLYLGGYAGVAFGYKSFFIGPELVLAEVIGSGTVSTLGSSSDVPLNSFIVYPGFALMMEL